MISSIHLGGAVLEFHVNHPILFVLAGLLIAAVLGQSVYFLVKALRRSKQIGMDQKKIRKTIQTAAVFTIAPAVSIVISVITLSKSLGLPLPWLRLSVVGSLSYETVAAENSMTTTTHPGSCPASSPTVSCGCCFS